MSNKTVFARLIIDKMSSAIGNDGSAFNASTPTLAQVAISQAVTEFITTYVKSKSSYVGNMLTPPYSPDPVIADDHPIMGACVPTGGASDLASWLSQLSSNIVNGFLCGPGQLMVTFLSAYKPFAGTINVTTDDIGAACDGNDDPQLAAWEVIAQGIIDMLVNNVSGMTVAAMRTGQSQTAGPTAFVSYNYILGGAAAGRRRSDESYMEYEYLDWDIDTWDDYLWY